MPGIFAAVCQNGLGVAAHAIAGKLIADYANDNDNDNELLHDTLEGRIAGTQFTRARHVHRRTIRLEQWRTGNEI